MMTIAEKLRQEGEIKGELKGKIKGEIKTYQELLDKGILPKELAEQKIAELRKELENITERLQTLNRRQPEFETDKSK